MQNPHILPAGSAGQHDRDYIPLLRRIPALNNLAPDRLAARQRRHGGDIQGVPGAECIPGAGLGASEDAITMTTSQTKKES